jgi:phage terminase large subunit-like protein
MGRMKTNVMDETRARAAAEVIRRQQEERASQESIWDWFAPSCPCNLPPGSCRLHPRARPKQRPPDYPYSFIQPPDPDWRVFLMVAGRGGGKSMAGSRFVNDQVENHGVGEIVLVNATIGDTRDIMVEGPSGLIASAPPWFRPVYIPSKSRVEWPNGAKAYLRTSEEPDGLRGFNSSLVWGDEPGKWFYQHESWNQIGFILRNRVFPPPRCLLTGTPTPTDLFYEIEEKSQDSIKTKYYMVSWATRENATHLDDIWLAQQTQKWGHSLLGQQELGGIIIRRKEGALWVPDDFERLHFRLSVCPELDYIGVGVDPAAGGKNPGASETGIVVAGRKPPVFGSYVSHGVILDDRTSTGQPGDWGRAVVRAYFDWGASEVVAEINNGGAMVPHVIQTVPAEGGYPSGRNIPVVVVHASQGKTARAEPVQALYQAKRIQHYAGENTDLSFLERQMVQYMPGKSGQLLDRVDALVWILKKCIIDFDDGGDIARVEAGAPSPEFSYLGLPDLWSGRSF